VRKKWMVLLIVFETADALAACQGVFAEVY
jgi:hypothetical protein